MKRKRKNKGNQEVGHSAITQFVNRLVGLVIGSATLFFVYCLFGTVLDVMFGIQLY